MCKHLTVSINISLMELAAVAMALFCVYTAKPAIQYQKLFVDIQNIYQKSRFEMYFENKGCAVEYNAVCDYVEGLNCENIGLLLCGDSYEYPLWTRLKNSNTYLLQVVLDKDANKIPDCIVAIDREYSVGDMLKYSDNEYECVWNYNDDPGYAVLLKK